MKNLYWTSLFYGALCTILIHLSGEKLGAADSPRPNIIFVMADDMGWGQTSYRNHPLLKTPHLDSMAANGLRFERFYAGGPVCSPTRATVLTGRSHDRTGVLSHGYALRLQEKTIGMALREAGYVTGHFGKWHLNGLRGPGVPILESDTHHPGKFGFDEWVSTSNFFDRDPLLSRQGKIEEFTGDSSEIIMEEALRFIEKNHSAKKPVFAMIWYGTPHTPFRASPQDRSAFDHLDPASANHHGELVAMDRSIGTLRRKLRDWGMADNTLLVFCSDNGGLPEIKPDSVGGLRGHKGSLYEGGLRVPGIMEWPLVIQKGRVTDYPASTMDLFPTIVDLLRLPKSVLLQPVDGVSLKPLFSKEPFKRAAAIPFRYQNKLALVEDQYKLIVEDLPNRKFSLYDLRADPGETRDLALDKRAIAGRMLRHLVKWNASVDKSFAGADYPVNKVLPPHPEPQFWYESTLYESYLPAWSERWEYKTFLQRRQRQR